MGSKVSRESELVFSQRSMWIGRGDHYVTVRAFGFLGMNGWANEYV